MNNYEFIQYHFVYRLASGEILLESDANLVPPQVGAVIRLPSASDEKEIIRYRIKEVQFVPERQELVRIEIEVEPI